VIGRMTSAVAGLCLLATTGTAPAQTFLRDFIPGPQSYPLMGATTPDEVLSIVRSMAYEPLTMPLLRRQTYRVRAVDRNGEEVRIVVDARAGRVLSVTSLAPQLTRPPAYDAYSDERRFRGNGFRGQPAEPQMGDIPDEPRVIYGSRNYNAAAPRQAAPNRMPSPQDRSAPRDLRSPQDAARQDASRSQSARATPELAPTRSPQSETRTAPVPRARPAQASPTPAAPAQVARDSSQDSGAQPQPPTVAPPPVQQAEPPAAQAAPEPAPSEAAPASTAIPPVQGFE